MGTFFLHLNFESLGLASWKVIFLLVFVLCHDKAYSLVCSVSYNLFYAIARGGGV